MNKITKKIEKGLMIINFEGDFHKDDVINEYNKEMEKYKEEGWKSVIIDIKDGEEKNSVVLKVQLEKSGEVEK